MWMTALHSGQLALMSATQFSQNLAWQHDTKAKPSIGANKQTSQQRRCGTCHGCSVQHALERRRKFIWLYDRRRPPDVLITLCGGPDTSPPDKSPPGGGSQARQRWVKSPPPEPRLPDRSVSPQNQYLSTGKSTTESMLSPQNSVGMCLIMFIEAEQILCS